MKYNLSEIMDIIGGGTPKTTKKEYWNGTIPWLSVKDFNNDQRYVYTTEKTITELGLINSSAKLLEKDDTIISARGTVGALAMIPFPMAFNQSCYGLRAKEKIVNPVFLYYLIKFHIEALKKNTHGSVFDTITKDTFSGIEVDIPVLDVQKRIAKILSSIDDKIELNNKINENLEQQVYTLFSAWFEPFGKIDHAILNNWKKGILGDIISITSGKRPPMKQILPDDKTKIPIVGAASIMGYTNSILYDEPILVTGRVGTHGVIQRLKTSCWPSDNTLVIKSNFYEYTYQVLHRIDYVNMNRGSTQPLITQTDLKNVPIIIPHEAVMLEFEEVAGTLMAMHEYNRKENEKLVKLRDILLYELMSGKIEVSDIQI